MNGENEMARQRAYEQPATRYDKVRWARDSLAGPKGPMRNSVAGKPGGKTDRGWEKGIEKTNLVWMTSHELVSDSVT